MAGPSQFQDPAPSADDLFFDSRHPENQPPLDGADSHHPIAQAVNTLAVDATIPTLEGTTPTGLLQHQREHYPAVDQAAEYLRDAFKAHDAEAKTQGRKWLTCALRRTGVGFNAVQGVVDGEMRRLAQDAELIGRSDSVHARAGSNESAGGDESGKRWGAGRTGSGGNEFGERWGGR